MSDQDHTDKSEAKPTPPEHVVRTLAEEEMAAESPEGRPPRLTAWRRSLGVMGAVGLLFILVVVMAFVLLPAGIAGFFTVAVILIYILAGAPAWGAALLRRKERREAEGRVRKELGGEQRP